MIMLGIIGYVGVWINLYIATIYLETKRHYIVDCDDFALIGMMTFFWPITIPIFLVGAVFKYIGENVSNIAYTRKRKGKKW